MYARCRYWAVAFPAWFLVAAFSSVFLYERWGHTGSFERAYHLPVRHPCSAKRLLSLCAPCSMNMCDVKPCTSRTTVSGGANSYA